MPIFNLQSGDHQRETLAALCVLSVKEIHEPTITVLLAYSKFSQGANDFYRKSNQHQKRGEAIEDDQF